MATHQFDVLSQGEQRKLNDQKKRIRFENEKYLQAHPELRHMMDLLFAELLERKPKDSLNYAAKYFTYPELRKVVEQWVEKGQPASSGISFVPED